MLVLSRQLDETIMIGDDIAITVVDIRQNSRAWCANMGLPAPQGGEK